MGFGSTSRRASETASRGARRCVGSNVWTVVFVSSLPRVLVFRVTIPSSTITDVVSRSKNVARKGPESRKASVSTASPTHDHDSIVGRAVRVVETPALRTDV